MKAVVQDRYGPPEVLRIEEVARPIPKADEILIRVRASTVTQTDTHARRADLFLWRFVLGLRRPRSRTLGVELAGEVEAVGAAVRAVQGRRRGIRPPVELLRRARGVRLRLGACGVGSQTGWDELRRGGGRLRRGLPRRSTHYERLVSGRGAGIVIYGASGSLGTAAVQLAKHFGAHVTAVCGTDHVELVRSLGADEVVDYRRQDFTKSGQT